MGDGGGGSGGFGDGRQRLAEVEMAAVLDLAIDLAACGGVWRRGGCGSEKEGNEKAEMASGIVQNGGDIAEISPSAHSSSTVHAHM